MTFLFLGRGRDYLRIIFLTMFLIADSPPPPTFNGVLILRGVIGKFEQKIVWNIIVRETKFPICRRLLRLNGNRLIRIVSHCCMLTWFLLMCPFAAAG